MCEHCDAGTSWEKAVSKDDRIPCQFHLETEPGQAEFHCGAFATRQFTERVVERHLCAAHQAQENAALDQGLGDALREAGLQEGVDFLPIALQPEQCDEEDCDAPAAYAEMVVSTYSFCTLHSYSLDD